MALTRQDIIAVIQSIDEAIVATITGGVASFSVAGGTSYQNLDITQLKALRREYAWMLYLYDNSVDGTSVRTFPSWSYPAGNGNG